MFVSGAQDRAGIPLYLQFWHSVLHPSSSYTTHFDILPTPIFIIEILVSMMLQWKFSQQVQYVDLKTFVEQEIDQLRNSTSTLPPSPLSDPLTGRIIQPPTFRQIRRVWKQLQRCEICILAVQDFNKLYADVDRWSGRTHPNLMTSHQSIVGTYDHSTRSRVSLAILFFFISPPLLFLCLSPFLSLHPHPLGVWAFVSSRV